MNHFVGIIICTSILPLQATENPGTAVFQKRVNFNQRLEPAGDAILHGAGQDNQAFAVYSAVLHTTEPVIFMNYWSIENFSRKRGESLRKELSEASDHFLIPQIGLAMTHDGKPEKHYEHKVAAGEMDSNIEELCEALKLLNRPAFLRIGYECNGQWNGYEPATYKLAFRRVTEAIRRHKLDEIATVWCIEPGAKNTNYMSFYPGDEYVDWWSIDIFGRGHFTSQTARAFLEDSLKHRKPLMIGESTPRRIGVNQTGSWESWYQPYFNLLRSQPNFKAFCYINWNWARHEQWKEWGDARVEKNRELLALYQKEIQNPFYLHADSEENTRKSLGLPFPGPVYTNALSGNQLAKQNPNAYLRISNSVCAASPSESSGNGSISLQKKLLHVNLSQEGTVDWAHWGLNTEWDYTHKAGITPLISNVSIIGNGEVQRFRGSAFENSWLDGTPTKTTDSTRTGIAVNGVDNGFQIIVSADTRPRTLSLHCGLWKSQGRLEACLSDGSIAPLVDTSLMSKESGSNHTFILTYAASKPNQKLVVSWTIMKDFDEKGKGTVGLQAATLKE